MNTPTSGWDVERAAAWLRKHAWGDTGEAPAAPQPAAVPAPPVEPEASDDEIDIAGWPALVAPFYD